MPSDNAQTVINQVLFRVRDPDAQIHAREFCVDLLSRLQWLLNNHSRLVVSVWDMATFQGQQIYTLPQATGDQAEAQGMTVLVVAHQARRLARMTLSQLRALDPKWPRTQGGRYEGFLQLGYTHLVLWPALDHPDTVAVLSTKLTTPVSLLGPEDALDIPSESTPRLMQLMELLLLLRQRDWPAFNALLAGLRPRRRSPNAPSPQEGTPQGMVAG